MEPASVSVSFLLPQKTRAGFPFEYLEEEGEERNREITGRSSWMYAYKLSVLALLLKERRHPIHTFNLQYLHRVLHQQHKHLDT